MCEKTFYERHQATVNFWTFIVLIATMCIMGWQSFETRRSVNFTEKQSRSYVAFTDVLIMENSEGFRIIRVGRKTGSSPILSIENEKDMVFWISSAQLKRYYLKPNENESKIFFFKKKLFNEIFNILVDKEITGVRLKNSLDNLKENPISYMDPRNNISNMTISFLDSHVFDDIDEWQLSLNIPYEDNFEISRSGRSASAGLLNEIDKKEKILFCYYVISYATVNNTKIKTHYFGYLDKLIPLKLKDDTTVYPFFLHKTWIE